MRSPLAPFGTMLTPLCIMVMLLSMLMMVLILHNGEYHKESPSTANGGNHYMMVMV